MRRMQPAAAKGIAMAPTPVIWSLLEARIEEIKVPRDRDGQFHTQVAGSLQPV
jgi:hypothetical protein